jgi:type II secretory ATPase GspE/PulE/Tfp pilus assembly ATPase PilB-like protein
MNVEPFLITSTVRAVLAQRLVRKICVKCKKEYKPSELEISEFGVPKEGLKGMKFYKGAGCSECNGSGYKGRTGLYELLIVDDRIRDLVVKHESIAIIRNAACQAGMKTLRENGLTKVMDGITTIEEVLRETKEYA